MKLQTQEQIDYGYAKKGVKQLADTISSYKKQLALAKYNKQPFARLQQMLAILNNLKINA